MIRPVVLAVDDDAQVLSAVGRDLRARFGKEYRVVKARSGAEALQVTRKLKGLGVPVALFVVDERMPEMKGTDFLVRALEMYPDARRVLLTAYADTESAITAINDVRLDRYLTKPWDPPEELLYPHLEELLEIPSFPTLRKPSLRNDVIRPAWATTTSTSPSPSRSPVAIGRVARWEGTAAACSK